MDTHFFETPLRQNLPVLMGLLGVWNSSFLGHSARAILPCKTKIWKRFILGFVCYSLSLARLFLLTLFTTCLVFSSLFVASVSPPRFFLRRSFHVSYEHSFISSLTPHTPYPQMHKHSYDLLLTSSKLTWKVTARECLLTEPHCHMNAE